LSIGPEHTAQERVTALERSFRADRKRLWALAYRMTGSGADADDVLQDAFLRLSALAPSRFPDDATAWLFRTTANLAIDALRRRRRRRYVGVWLPEPDESDGPLEVGGASADSTLDAPIAAVADAAAHYELAESATFAFLLALEALGPRQRAVLLLRDAFGRTAAETASLLGTSEGNVRVLHLRARRALEAYDRRRCRPSAALRERNRVALERLLACLDADDAAGLERLLAHDVHTLTDAGGEFTALTAPLVGAAAVGRLYRMAALHRRQGGTRVHPLEINGFPAALIEVLRPVRRQAPLTLMRCELDGEGRICAIHAILASRKLARLRPLPVALDPGERRA
jgi:RNA polymerase sigma-70 factor (ECF subfamily)